MNFSARFILLASSVLTLVLITRLVADAAQLDAKADRVLGQPDFTSSTATNGAIPPNARLTQPRGVSVSRNGRIYVADAGAAIPRVLSWPNATSFGNGVAADIVITADLQSPGLNLANPSNAVEDSLGNLYVADTDNNRVLKFNAPITNGVVASVVLGQPNFNSNAQDNGGVSARSLNGPFGLAVDSNNNLYVADTLSNRILKYSAPVNTTFMSATVVVGQPGFTTNGTNQGGLSASSLNDPFGVAIDGSGNLYVSDSQNNRILKYTAPITNGMAAARVLGQSDFTHNLGGTSATKMFFPYGLAINHIGHIFVADIANNRVLQFSPPVTNGVAAIRVFGQPNFTASLQNYPNPPGTPTDGNFYFPYGVAFDANQNMYTVENLNHRVLGFDKPSAYYFFPFIAR